MGDPREMLQEFQQGVGALMKADPKFTQSFMTFCDNFGENRSLSVKQKELIAIGIALYARCEHCLVFHIHQAFSVGSTPEEILEAGTVAIEFGGGPSMTYLSTFFLKCIETFKKSV